MSRPTWYKNLNGGMSLCDKGGLPQPRTATILLLVPSGLPCLHRGHPLLSPPFSLVCGPYLPPSFLLRHLYSDIPTPISSPRLPRSCLLTCYGPLFCLSYHYLSRLVKHFFYAEKEKQLFDIFILFFCLNPCPASGDLFPRASSRSISIHAQPLGSFLRGFYPACFAAGVG